jgi:hypothetical protein
MAHPKSFPVGRTFADSDVCKESIFLSVSPKPEQRVWESLENKNPGFWPGLFMLI